MKALILAGIIGVGFALTGCDTYTTVDRGPAYRTYGYYDGYHRSSYPTRYRYRDVDRVRVRYNDSDRRRVVIRSDDDDRRVYRRDGNRGRWDRDDIRDRRRVRFDNDYDDSRRTRVIRTVF